MITATQKEHIRQRLADGERGIDLAREFGISRQRISKIKGNITGRTHRPNPLPDTVMRMQIQATIWLVQTHVMPELSFSQSAQLQGYLRRLALACGVPLQEAL